LSSYHVIIFHRIQYGAYKCLTERYAGGIMPQLRILEALSQWLLALTGSSILSVQIVSSVVTGADRSHLEVHRKELAQCYTR